MRGALGMAMLLLSLGASALTTQDVALPPEQEARYRTLIHELRCLVCQNQTIADSNAELASDLRRQVHDQIVAGASDTDIRRYVTERYGDFVLYKPPLSARTILLWVGPFLVVLVAVGFVLRRLMRKRLATAPDAADAAQLRKLLDEERG